MADVIQQAVIEINVTQNVSAAVATVRSELAGLDAAAATTDAAMASAFSNASIGVSVFTQGVRDTGDEVENLGQRTTQSLGQTAAGFAVLATALLPIKAATSDMMQMDTTMHNVASISGIASSEIGTVTQQLNDMGIAAGKSPVDLANALYNVASSGYAGQQALDIVGKSAYAATAGLSTTQTAATATVAVLNSYKDANDKVRLSVDDLSRVEDVAFQTVNKGVLTYENYASGIGQVTGQASAMGVSIEEVSAAVALMTDKGLSSDAAFVSMNGILTALAKPTKTFADAIHAAGYENATALVHAQGLTGALNLLHDASGGSAEGFNKLVPNVRAMRGVLDIAKDGTAEYAAMLDSFSVSALQAGGVQAAFAEQSKAASHHVDQMKAALEAAGQTAMENFAPVLITVTDDIKQAAEWFRSLPPDIQKWTVGIIAAAGAVGLLGGAVTLLTIALGALLSPIVLVIAAGVALGAGVIWIIQNWSQVVDFFKKLPDEVGGYLGDLGRKAIVAIEAGWALVTGWIADTARQMWDAGTKWIDQLIKGMQEKVAGIWAVTQTIGSIMMDQLMPHSPPKAAPWLYEAGQRWIAELGRGMTDADFSFVDSLGASLETHFKNILGPSASSGQIATLVFGTQADISAAISAIEQGGTVTEAMLQRIQNSLHGQSSEVMAVVSAYLQLVPLQKQVADLEKDKLAIQDKYTPLLEAEQAAQDVINARLRDANDALQVYKDNLSAAQAALADGNDQLKQQKDILSDDKAVLADINDKIKDATAGYREQLAALQDQTDELKYQSSIEQHGASEDLKEKSRAVRDENRAWNKEKLDLEERIAAATAAHDTATAAALTAQMKAEKDAHDNKMELLRSAQDVASDNLSALKDKEQDAADKLKGQQEDIKHQQFLTVAGFKDQQTAAQAVIDQQQKIVDERQHDVDNLQGAVNQAQKYVTEQQHVVDGVQREHDIEQRRIDDLKTAENHLLAIDDKKIAAIQRQEKPLQDALKLAQDRLKIEDTILTKLNEQAATMSKAAGGAGGAGGKGSAAAAEKERLQPIQDKIDETQKAIREEDNRWLLQKVKLEGDVEAARNSNNVAEYEAAQARLRAGKDYHDTVLLPLNEQLQVENNNLAMAKDKTISVGEAMKNIGAMQNQVKANATAVQKALETASQTADDHREDLTHAMGRPKESAEQLTKDLISTINNAKEGIGTAMGGLGDAGHDALNKAWGLFGGKSTVSDTAARAFTDTAIAIFTGNPTTGPLLNMGVDAVQNGWQKALGLTGTTSTVSAAGASAFVTSFITPLQALPFTGPIVAALEAMKTNANTTLGIKGNSSDFMSGVSKVIVDTYNGVFGGKPFNAAGGSAIDELIKMATGKVGGDSSGPFFDIGKQTTHGVGSGLTASDVLDFIKTQTGIVMGAIETALRAAGIIHSPSERMMPIGRDIVAGLLMPLGDAAAPTAAGKSIIDNLVKQLLAMTGSSGTVGTAGATIASALASGMTATQAELAQIMAQRAAASGSTSVTQSISAQVAPTMVHHFVHHDGKWSVDVGGKIDGATDDFNNKLKQDLLPAMQEQANIAVGNGWQRFGARYFGG